MSEKWLPIRGYEGLYEISDAGRVRSLRRTCATKCGAVRTVPGKLLVAKLEWTGYLRVGLNNCGDRRWHAVHRLVLSAFVDGPKEGLEACHNNGIRNDNRLSNLRWDTKVGNQHDRIAHGTHTVGERNPNAKLTANDADRVRTRRRAGERVKDIAEEFGITPMQVWSIATGRQWKELRSR